jgi:hypothetical protein
VSDGEQLDFDFHAPATDGYDAWQWDRVEAERRIAEAWCLPLGQRVRVKLWNLDQEFTGKLRVEKRPARIHPKEPLMLRVDSMPFLNTEIEACAVVEAPGG